MILTNYFKLKRLHKHKRSNNNPKCDRKPSLHYPHKTHHPQDVKRSVSIGRFKLFQRIYVTNGDWALYKGTVIASCHGEFLDLIKIRLDSGKLVLISENNLSVLSKNHRHACK